MAGSGERNQATLTPAAETMPDLFRRVVDAGPTAVAILTGPPDFVYQYVNEALQSITPDRQMVGVPFAEAWPDLAGELIPVFERVIATGEPAVERNRRFEIHQAPYDLPRTVYMTAAFARLPLDGEAWLLIRAFDTTEEVRARDEAEQRAAEAQRREAELDAIFESMTDGLILYDTEGTLVRINRAGEEILGYGPGEERPPVEERLRRLRIMGPDGEPLPLEEVPPMRALRGETITAVPIMVHALDGVTKWVSVSAAPVRDASGLQAGAIITFTDITQRRRAEEERERAAAQLRDVVDNSPTVIYFKDTEGRLLLVNEQFARLFGRPKDEIVGHTDDVLVPKEYAEAVRANDRAVLRGGEPLELEEQLLDHAGVVRTFISVKFPLRSSSGEIYGVAGVSTDITERKREEERVRDSEQRFRKVFDEGSLGMLLVGMDQRILRANQRLADMLGYSVERLRGMDVHGITTAQEAVEADVLFGRLLNGEIPSYSLEKDYVRRDGSTFIGLLTVSLLRDAEGRPQSTLGMVEDITARKQAEEALKERDAGIRRAYVDVIDAVTGGKLVLMTPDEVRAALGRSVLGRHSLPDAGALGEARREIREAARSVKGCCLDLDAFVLAVSEGLTNAVKHGVGGEYEVRFTDETLQVVVADHGRGIDFHTLPKATLLPGFSTKASLGMGFTIMLDVCDRVLLSTQPGLTVLVLETDLRATGQAGPGSGS